MLHQSANVASITSRRAALVTLGDLIKPPIGPCLNSEKIGLARRLTIEATVQL